MKKILACLFCVAVSVVLLYASSDTPDSLLLENVYAGQRYLMEDKYDLAIEYLRKAEDMLSCDAIKDTDVLSEAACIVYNSLGIYSINRDMNYENAMRYFLRGCKYAENSDLWEKHAVLLSNLVLVYNIRKDSSGLEYAEDVYRIGQEHGNDEIAGMGAYLCASMLFLGGQTDRAEEYLDIALNSDSHGYTDIAMIYKLKAEILYAEGDAEGAEHWFEQALRNMDSISVSTYTDVFLCYGEFLMAENRNREAIAVLKKGMDQALSTGNRVNLFNIYLRLSEAYGNMGDDSSALYWYTQFHDESYDVFRIKREREISNLKLQYEQEKHENEVSRYELELLRKKKQSWLLLSILIVLVPLSVCIWMMYRNKDRMYTQIARSYKQLADKMNEGSLKYVHSSLAEDRNEEILKQLTGLMETEKVYRKNDISIESLSDMLQINRTYLSQVINGQLGMSFNSYINAYRIQEAIAVLSDPGNDIPLKALAMSVGFNSLSLFYKLFREKVGMPPAKFREKIIFLSKENN